MFSVSLKDSTTNKLPFSCEESRQQVFQAALKKNTEEDKKEIQEATASLTAAKKTSVDALSQ